MATTDPAVEAAQRVWWNAFYPKGADKAVATWDFDKDVRTDGPAVRYTEAAREALAPIRELHRLCEDDIHKRCCECVKRWPCATARLIYTTEELNR